MVTLKLVYVIRFRLPRPTTRFTRRHFLRRDNKEQKNEQHNFYVDLIDQIHFSLWCFVSLKNPAQEKKNVPVSPLVNCVYDFQLCQTLEAF